MEKPLSGTEIVEEIERETDGRWKPSSGSIYPLLAWLQAKTYTVELPTNESGMKRYVLTDEGKTFFEEQVQFGQTFLEKLECLAPMLIGGFQFGIDHENSRDIRESAKNVLKTFINLRTLKDYLTKPDIIEIVTILKECDIKLKGIFQRIKEKKPE
jgi:DNA-binding PadR family transcriptional regulator